MSTRDQFAAWLGQIHADRELSAHTFKFAFALTQVVDANGFVRSATVTKFARDVDDSGEAVEGLLGRLAARGHLKTVGDGPEIEGFRLMVHAVNTAAGAASSRSPRCVCRAKRKAEIHNGAIT